MNSEDSFTLDVPTHVLLEGELTKQNSGLIKSKKPVFVRLFAFPPRLEYDTKKQQQDAELRTVALKKDSKFDVKLAEKQQLLVQSADRAWTFEHADKAVLELWLAAVKSLLAVVNDPGTLFTVTERVDAAARALRDAVAVGKIKYDKAANKFLRPEHGVAVKTALGKFAAALDELNAVPGESRELRLIRSGYEEFMERAERLVHVLSVRVKAHVLFEQFHTETVATQVSLRKGERDLPNAKSYFAVAKTALTTLQQSPDFRLDQAFQPGSMLRRPSVTAAMLPDELKQQLLSSSSSLGGSGPGGSPTNRELQQEVIKSAQLDLLPQIVQANRPDDEAAAQLTLEMGDLDVMTDEERAAEQKHGPKARYIDEVELFLSEAPSIATDLERQIGALATGRRPSIAKSQASSADRALFALEQGLKSLGTLYKGAPFLSLRKFRPVIDLAQAYIQAVEQVKQLAAEQPPAPSPPRDGLLDSSNGGGHSADLARYLAAWRKCKTKLLELQQRMDVHTLIGSLSGMTQRVQLCIAGRNVAAAKKEWAAVTHMIRLLLDIRDKGVLSNMAPKDGGEDSKQQQQQQGDDELTLPQGLGVETEPPVVADDAAPRQLDPAWETATADGTKVDVATLECPVYVLDIHMCLAAYFKKNAGLEAKVQALGV